MIGEFFIITAKIRKDISRVFVNEKDKILDLGCGKKPPYQRSMKGNIICFDKAKTKITHVLGDADSLPFKPNSFDKVISINSFYYFKNPFYVAQSVHKILKKDGKFVLVLPFIYPIHDAPHDKYRFTEYGIKELLKDFHIKEITPIGGIFNLPAVFFHSVIKGFQIIIPNNIKYLGFILLIILYPFYIITQLISLLDFIDRTGRWATYYFVVAVKK